MARQRMSVVMKRAVPRRGKILSGNVNGVAQSFSRNISIRPAVPRNAQRLTILEIYPPGGIVHRERETMKMHNMTGPNGRKIPNQFEIVDDDGAIYFLSYNTIIAKKQDGKIYLDADKWDYSVTTGKYRNLFLGMDKAETEKAIKAGEIILCNLNA